MKCLIGAALLSFLLFPIGDLTAQKRTTTVKSNKAKEARRIRAKTNRRIRRPRPTKRPRPKRAKTPRLQSPNNKVQSVKPEQPKNRTNSKEHKGKTTKKTPRRKMSRLQREVLRYQMEVLLTDPEMGRIYRQILRNKKK